MKDIYFKNYKGKNLYIDDILLYYDEPLIFTCLDDEDNIYLCNLIESRKYFKWIISKINNEVIDDLLSNKIDIYTSINQPEIVIAEQLDNNHENIKYTYNINFEDINKLDLPEEGIFLNY